MTRSPGKTCNRGSARNRHRGRGDLWRRGKAAGRFTECRAVHGMPGGFRESGITAGNRESCRGLFQLSYPIKTGGGQDRDYGPCDDEKDPTARGQLGGLLFHGSQTPGFVFQLRGRRRSCEGIRANAVCKLTLIPAPGRVKYFAGGHPGMERKVFPGRPSDVPTGIASVASQVYFR